MAAITTCAVASFSSSFKLSLPWDQTTPVGYGSELILDLPIGFSCMVVNGVFLLLFVSICQHHQAFYKMFKYSINNSKRSDGANRCDAKFICDLIDFYNSVEKLDGLAWIEMMIQISLAIINNSFVLFLQMVFIHGRYLQFTQCNSTHVI